MYFYRSNIIISNSLIYNMSFESFFLSLLVSRKTGHFFLTNNKLKKRRQNDHALTLAFTLFLKVKITLS